jgi:hypothetical protein
MSMAASLDSKHKPDTTDAGFDSKTKVRQKLAIAIPRPAHMLPQRLQSGKHPKVIDEGNWQETRRQA